MGLFDELQCHYPLPVEGANKLTFQTKDTPAQSLDRYEIRADGTLWHKVYQTEDRSNPGTTGLERLSGVSARVDAKWVLEPMTGEVLFYGSASNGSGDLSYLEFSAYFIDGTLLSLITIARERPKQKEIREAQQSDSRFGAPIKTCNYCGAKDKMPTFMGGETVCDTCMSKSSLNRGQILALIAERDELIMLLKSRNSAE